MLSQLYQFFFKWLFERRVEQRILRLWRQSTNPDNVKILNENKLPVRCWSNEGLGSRSTSSRWPNAGSRFPRSRKRCQSWVHLYPDGGPRVKTGLGFRGHCFTSRHVQDNLLEATNKRYLTRSIKLYLLSNYSRWKSTWLALKNYGKGLSSFSFSMSLFCLKGYHLILVLICSSIPKCWVEKEAARSVKEFFSTWNDWKTLKKRMSLHKAYIGSKVSGYGCPIRF